MLYFWNAYEMIILAILLTNLVEGLSIVDTDNTSDHIGQHNHVSKMCLHNSRFLVGESLFLRFAQLFHQSHRFHLQTTCESTSVG